MVKNVNRALDSGEDGRRLPTEHETGTEALLDGELVSLDRHRRDRVASHTMQSLVPPLYRDDEGSLSADAGGRNAHDSAAQSSASSGVYNLLRAIASTEGTEVFELQADHTQARLLVDAHRIIAVDRQAVQKHLKETPLAESSRARMNALAAWLREADNLRFTAHEPAGGDLPDDGGSATGIGVVELLYALNGLRCPELAGLRERIEPIIGREHGTFWLIERGRTPGIERVLSAGEPIAQSLEMPDQIVALADDLARKSAALGDAFSPGTTNLYAFTGEHVWLSAASGSYIVIGRAPSRRFGTLLNVMDRVATALTHKA